MPSALAPPDDKTIVVTTVLPRPDAERLRDIAAQHHRSVSNALRVAVCAILDGQVRL